MSIGRTRKLITKNVRIAAGYINLDTFDKSLTRSRILINSVPKCGTNLVQEIVQKLPGVRGTFRRTIHGEPDVKSHRFIENISSGSCATAHLFHSIELHKCIVENDVRVIHVVRDFRDSLISQANFLDALGNKHRHGVLFDGVDSFDEKLQICLDGVPGIFKGWKEILPRFSGWATSDVLIVKYEDLYEDLYRASPNSDSEELSRIAKYLDISSYDESSIVSKATNKNSLTYNSPGINKWKTVLNSEQKEMVNHALREHLELYGYEV